MPSMVSSPGRACRDARPRRAARARRTRTISTPLRTVMPSRASASSTMAAHSGSSPASGVAASSTVTSAPSRRNACANSRPTAPAPRTIRCRGQSVSSKTVSLVRCGVSARPGTAGRRRRAGGDDKAARPDRDVADRDGAPVRKACRAVDHAHAEPAQALARDRCGATASIDVAHVGADAGEIDAGARGSHARSVRRCAARQRRAGGSDRQRLRRARSRRRGARRPCGPFSISTTGTPKAAAAAATVQAARARADHADVRV